MVIFVFYFPCTFKIFRHSWQINPGSRFDMLCQRFLFFEGCFELLFLPSTSISRFYRFRGFTMVNTDGNIIKQRNGRHFRDRFVNAKQSRTTIKTYFLPTKVVNTTKLSSKIQAILARILEDMYSCWSKKSSIETDIGYSTKRRKHEIPEKLHPKKKEPFHLTFASSNSTIATLENIDIVIDIILMSLLLTANIFYNFF